MDFKLIVKTGLGNTFEIFCSNRLRQRAEQAVESYDSGELDLDDLLRVTDESNDKNLLALRVCDIRSMRIEG